MIEKNFKYFSYLIPADADESGLFNHSTFETYLAPKLVEMFHVRDIAIRLILLKHLNSFVHVFELDDLKTRVLPELLVGVKDTDERLVSTTLRTLADLVPVLGVAAVVGGKRARLFTDGTPNKLQRPLESALPERPSPDGGEDKTLESPLTSPEDVWSDWENPARAPEIAQNYSVKIVSRAVLKLILTSIFFLRKRSRRRSRSRTSRSWTSRTPSPGVPGSRRSTSSRTWSR